MRQNTQCHTGLVFQEQLPPTVTLQLTCGLLTIDIAVSVLLLLPWTAPARHTPVATTTVKAEIRTRLFLLSHLQKSLQERLGCLPKELEQGTCSSSPAFAPPAPKKLCAGSK